MLIRSQDGLSLFPISQFILEIRRINSASKNSIVICNTNSDEPISIVGNYKNQERAMEVMNSIQSFYDSCNNIIYEGFPSSPTHGWFEHRVFEMPKE